MIRPFLVLSLISAALMAQTARAQLDATSAVLLRSSGKSPAADELDSARYKIRSPESRKDEDEIEEKPGTYIPSPVPPAKSSVKKSGKRAVQSPVASPVPVGVSVPVGVPVQSPVSAEAPPVTEQMRQLLFGDDDGAVDEYRKQIHPSDPRGNVVDIAFAPAYFSNASQSGYSFRRYHADGPGYVLGMDLWVTPFFGIQANYFSSLSSSIRSGGVDAKPMDVQAFAGGVRFRRHFGYQRKSPVLSWGIDYSDAENRISKDATAAVGRKTTGFSLAVEALLPANNAYAHTVDLDLRPRLAHSELATRATARSGSKSDTTAIGLAIGGRWSLDRHNQLFWKGQYSVERSLFDGAASTVDPHTGQTPNGVSVTNSLAIFYLGLQWGS